MGQFDSPYFLGDDPTHEDPDGRFELNYQTGSGRVATDHVHWFLAVPKATATAQQPFPVVTWAHGTGLFNQQAVIRAGHLAKQGMRDIRDRHAGARARARIPAFSRSPRGSSRRLATTSGSTHFLGGRAHDLNGDGIADSGGYVWTAHLFHNRDNIRQAVIDEMMAVRILKSFDGQTRSDQDYDGDGAPNLAGDFDGDGVPDLGGDAPITTGGDSLGGIVAMVHGATNPYVTASTPISGGGGLLDVAVRSELTPTPVLEQTFSPLVIAVPAANRGPTDDAPSACGASQIACASR